MATLKECPSCIRSLDRLHFWSAEPEGTVHLTTVKYILSLPEPTISLSVSNSRRESPNWTCLKMACDVNFLHLNSFYVPWFPIASFQIQNMKCLDTWYSTAWQTEINMHIPSNTGLFLNFCWHQTGLLKYNVVSPSYCHFEDVSELF